MKPKPDELKGWILCLSAWEQCDLDQGSFGTTTRLRRPDPESNARSASWAVMIWN